MRKIENQQLQTAAYYDQLPNGLNVYVIPKPGFQQTFAMFSTKYGSIDREFLAPGDPRPTVVPDGIAHFLEHKMFEQESGEDVFNTFAKYGGSSNAFTTFDSTSYLFSCTDHVEENLTTLLNFVQEPYFTDQNVEKEKGIIGQEIRMYDDDADWRVFFNLLAGFYKEHPINIDIAGTVESIAEITKETLYKCYNTFYHPSNMIVVVVGDVDPARIHEVVRENQAKKDFKRQPEIERIFPKEDSQKVNEARIEKRMPVSIPKIQFGYKDSCVGLSGEDMLFNEYATAIGLEALIGKSSALFNQLYEAGIIDKNFVWSYEVSPHYAYSSFGGNSKEPERLLELTEQAFAKVREQGVPAVDFNRARVKMIGRVLSEQDSPRMLCRNFTNYRFRDANYFDIVPLLENLTHEQVNARLKEHLAPERRSVSLILPK